MARTPGPDYYALADGRQLFEMERDELAKECERRGLGIWESHCLLSAIEHRFRNGAKPGESETDDQAEKFWLDLIPYAGVLTVCETGILGKIDEERKKVGR